MSEQAQRYGGPKPVDRKVHPKSGRRKGEKAQAWMREFKGVARTRG